MENKIKIYTDGSCKGNPGPGGWGAVVFDNKEEIHLSGGARETTNNRMEMMAMVEALKYLHDKYKDKISKLSIEIYSDSNLIVQTINLKWKKKANTDLWEKIEALSAWLNIKFIWVKGHASNKYNNLADELAQAQGEKFLRKRT
ncbi:MAG: ribonuclease H [Candidatus Gracilibacteria bacterium]|jgi:ribonuclease HI